MDADLRRPVIIEEKPVCQMALSRVVSDCCNGAQPVLITDGTKAAADLASRHPVVVLIDLFTMNYDFAAVRKIADLLNPNPVVVLDDRENPIFAARSREAGASGYIAKAYELDRFSDCIRSVLSGETAFPEQARRQRSGSERQPRPTDEYDLSSKQYDVLMFIGLGMTNKEIAQAMGITTGTVKVHVHSVLKATGARNRTEASLIAGRLLSNRA